MNCENYRSFRKDQIAGRYIVTPAVDLDLHLQSCFKCVRWNEDLMKAEDDARGIAPPFIAATEAIPMPGDAASAIEKEAVDRLNHMNPHLRRTVTEMHKMMVWHQYAAASLQGLIASGYHPRHGTEIISDRKLASLDIANRACEYADAMMEQIHQRKMM